MARKQKESRKVKPEYTCCDCGHRWTTDDPSKGKCPKCGHSYYKWANYAEWCIAHARR